MGKNMQEFVNILDESILQDNIKFASLFILNYECLRDYLVSQMKGFLSDEFREIDGRWQSVESQKYKDEVKRLDSRNNKLFAALAWFRELEAINQNDIELFLKARDRRNSITHEFASELMRGFSEEDAIMFCSLLDLYRKVDKWWINEIEISIAGDISPNGYDYDAVIGGQAIILSLINEVALGKAEAYSELLHIIRQET